MGYTEEKGKKFATICILKVLVDHSDVNNPLTQQEIIDYLKEDHEIELRRAAVSAHLHALNSICGDSFLIKGLDLEEDNETREEDEEKPKKRGVWIKRSFSDKELQLLIDSVLYSKYINNEEAKTLINKINSLGSKSFRENSHSISRLKTVFHVGYTEFIKELGVLQQAITDGVRVSFSYGQYKVRGAEHIFEGCYKTVSPYHLAFVGGHYYMIGWDHENNIIDHYRIDKMKGATKLNLVVKPRGDTKLQGTKVADYIASHPFMSNAQPENMVFRIEEDKLYHVVDTFGNSYQIEKTEGKYKIIRVTCNKEDGFYWAMQFGGIVEILEPQALRDQIRDAVEAMALRYLQRSGDRYSEALRQFESSWVLDLSGVIVGSRTTHYNLSNLKRINLSDNNISDINFLKNYKKMEIVCLYNNPIKDISPLAKCDEVTCVRLINLPVTDLSPLKQMKNLTQLSLNLTSDVDYSVIYELEGLKMVTIYHDDEVDVAKLKEVRPDLHINSYKRKKVEPSKLCYYPEYPLNVIKVALGYDREIKENNPDILAKVEEIFSGFSEEEKEVSNLVFKQNLSDVDIAFRLDLSYDEVRRRWDSIEKKLQNKFYNKVLEPYTMVPSGKRSAKEERLKYILLNGK